jgi:hypothetical protein
MDHMEDTPKEKERGKNLVLYMSEFGTGYIVCGNMSGDEPNEEISLNQPITQKVLSCRRVLFNRPN